MRWVTLLLGLLPSVAGCGGAVAKNDGHAGAAGAQAQGSGGTATAEPDVAEVIDDVDHAGSNGGARSEWSETLKRIPS